MAYTFLFSITKTNTKKQEWHDSKYIAKQKEFYIFLIIYRTLKDEIVQEVLINYSLEVNSSYE